MMNEIAREYITDNLDYISNLSSEGYVNLL